jgi:DNA modification methylase
VGIEHAGGGDGKTPEGKGVTTGDEEYFARPLTCDLCEQTQEVLNNERRWHIQCSDVLDYLRSLPDGCVHCVCTSPPYYGLRDYGIAGQIGLEDTPRRYVERLVEVFREVRRVLHPSGCAWVDLGDSYAGGGGGNYTKGTRNTSEQNLTNVRNREEWLDNAGLKAKDLIGVPWLTAFAMRDDGWYLRQRVVLCKVSPMPESVRDRCTTATEELFMFTRQPRYFYDQDAERVPWSDNRNGFSGVYQNSEEPCSRRRQDGSYRSDDGLCQPPQTDGRNLWNWWLWRPEGFAEAHFSTFPTWLPSRCIRLGTSEHGVCPACAAPWRRVVQRERKPTRPALSGKMVGRDAPEPICTGNRDPQRHCTVRRSVGWEPSCQCQRDDVVPAVVFDPFSGAGTTVMVANRLGRRGIGCELNPEYVEMSRRRIANDDGLTKVETSRDTAGPLFEGLMP